MTKTKAVVIVVLLFAVVFGLIVINGLKDVTDDRRAAQAALTEAITTMNGGELISWNIHWNQGDQAVFSNISFNIAPLRWLDGPYITGGLVAIGRHKVDLYRSASSKHQPAEWGISPVQSN